MAWAPTKNIEELLPWTLVFIESFVPLFWQRCYQYQLMYMITNDEHFQQFLELGTKGNVKILSCRVWWCTHIQKL